MNTAIDFASPWFLAGLISLAVPFLLLLSKASTKRVMSFSSNEFLTQITQKSSNVIQWKRLLLLLIRLAFLAALALAFALPFISKTSGFSFGAPKLHRIYVLDNSLSMSYQENGKNLLEKAKEEILKTIPAESSSDSYSFYVLNQKLEPLIENSKNSQDFSEKLKIGYELLETTTPYDRALKLFFEKRERMQV